MRRAQTIREKYNTTAPSYDELYGDEQRAKYEKIHKTIGFTGKNILDIGCGTALLLEYMLGKTPSPELYICLDISEGMLQEAKKRIERVRAGHLAELVNADAENLPLRVKSIDNSYAVTVLFLTDNPSKAIDEACRVTKNRLVYTLLIKAQTTSVLRRGVLVAIDDKDYIFSISCGESKDATGSSQGPLLH